MKNSFRNLSIFSAVAVFAVFNLSSTDTLKQVANLRNLEEARSLALAQANRNSEFNQENVMYTFYEPSTADEKNLLQSWENAWNAVGWETRVLNLQDSRKHPDYDKYKQPLDVNTNGVYEKLHYLRWLAMASTQKGGYMCDYDVFPIPTKIEFLRPTRKGDTLPNNGTLTVYEFTLTGGVPSLVSGSPDEWDRLAHLLIEKSFDTKINNDEQALMSVKRDDRWSFILGGKVLKGHVALKEKVLTEDYCEMWFGFAAVHFNNFAIEKGVESGRLPAGSGASSRPAVAAAWMEEWNALCAD